MFNQFYFYGNKAFLPSTLLVLTSALFAGCASTGNGADAGKNLSSTKHNASQVDPYEDFNRSMYNFNGKVDNYVAKPISDAYIWITPGFFKSGVSNFFSNLKDINVVLNDHMQGKFEQGAEDTGRFITNSTIGLLGLFDVATEFGLKKHDEDFGQTLGVWGVSPGAYLVLPLLGPTTTRGVPGSVFDAAANPTSYVGMPVQLVSMLNARSNAEGALKFIDEASIDPYVFTREAYLQNLQHLVSDGKAKSQVDILPLEDELLSDSELDAHSAAKKTAPATTTAASNQNNVNKALDQAVVSLDKASSKLAESSKKLDKIAAKKAKAAKKTVH